MKLAAFVGVTAGCGIALVGSAGCESAPDGSFVAGAGGASASGCTGANGGDATGYCDAGYAHVVFPFTCEFVSTGQTYESLYGGWGGSGGEGGAAGGGGGASVALSTGAGALANVVGSVLVAQSGGNGATGGAGMAGAAGTPGSRARIARPMITQTA